MLSLFTLMLATTKKNNSTLKVSTGFPKYSGYHVRLTLKVA